MFNPKLMSKGELENNRRIILLELNRRYKKNKETKYGLLNKGFTDDEFNLFYNSINDVRFKTIVCLMSGLGLRISEACSLKVSDINLAKRYVFIRSQKDSHPSLMFLHDFVYNQLVIYFNHFCCDGVYVFPAVNDSCKTPFFSVGSVRNEFRRIRANCNLDFVYGVADDSRSRVHPLYRLTTHSLRHYFITHCSKKLNGDVSLVQKLARHKDVKNTLKYIHVSQDEIDKAISVSFDSVKSFV